MPQCTRDVGWEILFRYWVRWDGKGVDRQWGVGRERRVAKSGMGWETIGQVAGWEESETGALQSMLKVGTEISNGKGLEISGGNEIPSDFSSRSHSRIAPTFFPSRLFHRAEVNNFPTIPA